MDPCLITEDKDNTERCETCKFFTPDFREPTGICRRYPPTVVVIDHEVDSFLPEVHKVDWCGEYSEQSKKDNN